MREDSTWTRSPGLSQRGGVKRAPAPTGVPVEIGEEIWGNLYLTEKQGGEFTEADEQAEGILAGWAACRTTSRTRTLSRPLS